MNEFRVRSGSIDKTVQAEDFDDAVRKALDLAVDGDELSYLVRVKERGKISRYALTERFITLAEESQEEPQMVSLHSIYCPCERCKRARGDESNEGPEDESGPFQQGENTQMKCLHDGTASE